MRIHRLLVLFVLCMHLVMVEWLVRQNGFLLSLCVCVCVFEERKNASEREREGGRERER